jgi:holliday junction DNA helicase RuvA
MIASLKGTITGLTSQSCVIDMAGFGLLVQIPTRFSAELMVGKSAELFTSLVVREDSLTLFGFETPEARDLFNQLQTVTGIGPKVAQSALSTFDEIELSTAIAQNDAKTLEKIPGLGKKGAGRILLELREKVSKLSQGLAGARGPGVRAKDEQWRVQLLGALVGLGFSPREAEESIQTVATEYGATVGDENLSHLLRFALASRNTK